MEGRKDRNGNAIKVNVARLMYKIKKLRKYNYDMYIKTNIKALQSNTKSYHQCLQNILQYQNYTVRLFIQQLG